MIRQAEEPTRDGAPDPLLGGYRLDASPRRREGGSLLFAATAPDGSAATLQVSAEPVARRRARSRFRRLARARAKLGHPALLGVRDIGEHGGRVFVAAEPFPERSLADLLRDGPLDPNLALRLLQDVADGLDAAHAAGVVHRTLSGESVLLDGDRAQLDLFGLFTMVGQPTWGDVVRKDAQLHYESPEAVRGEELTAASNVYSLTGLLVHALTGQQPFVNRDPVMITYAHVSQPPPKPSERNSELPAGLDAFVARGMAKEPEERPKSAGALLAGAATMLRTASYATLAPRRELAPPAVAPAPFKAPAAGQSSPPPQRPLAPATSSSPPRAMPAAPAIVATALPADAPARLHIPLKARLAPFGPVLLVFLVAAFFGALLGTPGPGRQQVAESVRSPDAPALKRLDEIRFRLRDDLASASTADEQANLAARLAVAYGHAADNLSSPVVVSAAQDASAAYVSLEDAVQAGDEDAYEGARARVEAAEAKIASELSPSSARARRG